MNTSEADTLAKKNKANYCGSCGNIWNARWKFCKLCGAEFSQGENTKSQSQKTVHLIPVAATWWKIMLNKCFFKIDSKENVRQAVKQAYVVAYVVSTITIVFVLISLLTGESIGGIDEWAILDALVFALVGIGIQYYSRTAAVAGLVLLIFEKIFTIVESEMGVTGFLITVGFTIAFINGIRGTYGYQRLQHLHAS